MYLKRESEFQYHPGIEKIIEDVIGGGTIARTDLSGAIFKGVSLDELPPLVPVSKDDETGVYHVFKTAMIHAAVADGGKKYHVKKKHVFAVGDAVGIGGDFESASDIIKSIDKSPVDYDIIELAGSIGAAEAGHVLVLAKEKADAGNASPKYGDKESELPITMNKVDLTVANQPSGLLVRGTVKGSVMPFPVDKHLVKRLKEQGIRIV